ncbi:MAG: helix-turn-helix domain-containing protein [Dysgonamonadaceae bacterium]|nr:helix-turn-helix domain-containing protein [Dysgonamonadaceae bacterium]
MRIKECAKENKVTLKEVANKLGVTAQALQSVMHGNPTLNNLQKVANAIGVPIEDLFVAPNKPAIQPQTPPVPPVTRADIRSLCCPYCGKKLELIKRIDEK